ncbi:T9SS type A sorting domain-containing protein [Flavobacterium sp.]|uniref:T9SS type A sorting domain-containing protein n=1 Tax=Flavobacterium sp. TaxID=239 RepID=UPI00286DD2AE|nr:T9SS type A sorting domain-containing protein [Flavobacterium sp.]
MKKITFLVAFFLAAITGSYAQASEYSFSQSNGTYTSLVGETVLGTQTVANGVSAGALDDNNYTVALPFGFTFSGVAYASGANIYVNTNGFVAFGVAAPAVDTYSPIASTNVYDGAIAAFGFDCNGGYAATGTNVNGSPTITITAGSTTPYTVGSPIIGTGIPGGATVVSTTTTTVTISANCTSGGAGRSFNVGSGKISYVVTGTTPNQKLVIQFSKMRPYNATLRTIDYQIVLNETSNIVDLVYGASFGSASASTIQVGLRGSVNTNFLTRATTTNWGATTVGATNAATVTFSATVLPVSGLTFIFTPPNPCTGMPVGGTVAPALLAVCPTAAVAPLIVSGFTTGFSGLTYQWEQSTDNFATAPVDAVGGTGATTTTYTPPVFGGTTIYYRMRITCTGSGMTAYSSVSTITPPASPATQVSTLASVPTLVTAPLTFIAGNGGRRVVYFSDSATFTDPVDGNGPALVANAVYAGTGQQIVYDGTGTGVTVTGLNASTTYYVKAYEYLRCGAGPYDFYYNVTTGTNILTVTTASPPANDNFANAEAILCGTTYNGNTTNASIDETITPTTQFGVDLDSRNVWYKYVNVGGDQSVTLNLCGSSYDSSVLVLTGTTGALTAVAGNDDDATCGLGFETRSRVSFNAVGATTYYIAVEGWNAGNFGAYTMAVSCVAVNPPAVANQTCALALAVTVDGSDTNSDNSFGDVSAVQPSCDTFGVIQDVWFSFVAPTSGEVTCLVTPTTMSSANFNIYSGACGTLVAVAGTCNADLTGATSEALTGLIAGDTYFVQVWSNAAEQGTFKINMTDTTLATNSFDKANFTSYPNPVQDVLNISYRTNISSVSIFNLLGQEVLAKTINASEAKVDMSNLSNGTYLVKVTVDGLTKTIKVVKE